MYAFRPPTRHRYRQRRFPFLAGLLVPAAVLFLSLVPVTTLAAADFTTNSTAVSKSVIDYWGDDSETSAATAETAKSSGGALPELATVDQVLRLKPEEAQRGYPVDLRGVVTCVVQEHNAFIVQDATRAVFVINASPALALTKRGEFL